MMKATFYWKKEWGDKHLGCDCYMYFCCQTHYMQVLFVRLSVRALYPGFNLATVQLDLGSSGTQEIPVLHGPSSQ